MIHPIVFLVGYCVVSVPVSQSAAFAELCRRGEIACRPAGVIDEPDGGGQRRRFICTLGVGARLLRICSVAGVELMVDSRHGLPVRLRAVAARPGLWVSALLLFTLMLISSSVVWDIRVVGNVRLDEAQVIEVLKYSGLTLGTPKRSLDIDRIENRALILSDDISWISVNVFGTVVEVEIRETQPYDESEDMVSSNLVASRNGTIVELNEVRGNLVVELGEEVTEGQLLVGGIYGSDSEPLRFVRSRGSVIALCEREYEIEIPLKFDKKVYTGDKKTKKSLIFFEKEVKFFGNSRNLYTSCDTINREEYFYFWGVRLPFAIRTVTYAEYVVEQASRTEAQAKEQALLELWRRLGEQAPNAVVVRKELTESMTECAYILVARLETHEDIAQEKEIEVEIFGGR